MIIGMVFLTALMAVIVIWLLRQTLDVQPWIAATGGAPAAAVTRPLAKTALWVFLGVASSLFVLFVSAYAMRLGLTDWQPLPRPRLLLLNTAFLVGASLALQWAVIAARRGSGSNLRRGLLAGGLLTLAFLVGQLTVWKQMVDAGYFLSTSAATAFFYLLTAVHGLHVLGGLVAWARACVRVWLGPQGARWRLDSSADAAAPDARARTADVPPTAQVRLAAELCATYWHYLLVVWVALYALLVSRELGLAICSSAPL